MAGVVESNSALPKTWMFSPLLSPMNNEGWSGLSQSKTMIKEQAPRFLVSAKASDVLKYPVCTDSTRCCFQLLYHQPRTALLLEIPGRASRQDKANGSML